MILHLKGIQKFSKNQYPHQQWKFKFFMTQILQGVRKVFPNSKVNNIIKECLQCTHWICRSYCISWLSKKISLVYIGHRRGNKRDQTIFSKHPVHKFHCYQNNKVKKPIDAHHTVSKTTMLDRMEGRLWTFEGGPRLANCERFRLGRGRL